MPSIRVIDESGDMVTQEVSTGGVTFTLDDGTEFSPVVVERVEYENQGAISSTSSKNCRTVEHRRESSKKPDIVIEGIVSESEKEHLLQLDQQKSLSLISDLFSGPVAVRRTVVEQTSGLIEIIQDGEAQLAFTFQLIVKNSMHHDSALTPSIEGTAVGRLAEATDPLSGE